MDYGSAGRMRFKLNFNSWYYLSIGLQPS